LETDRPRITHQGEVIMTEDMDITTAGPMQRLAFPEWLNEGMALLLHLVETGRWKAMADRLRVQREGGYSGIDGFLFLLLYFASGQKQSISKFSQRVGHSGKKLAAVAGRKALPTQSSMSRVLAAVDQDMVWELAPWLLWEATGALEMLAHPAMQTTDADHRRKWRRLACLRNRPDQDGAAAT